jgi:hypothetical protein
VQHRGEWREPGQFLAALVALIQVRVDLGSLAWFDRADDIYAEQFTERPAGRVTHGASPRSSSASFSALSA